MNASAFLVLANELARDPNSDEARLRTAASRAYYATFHKALEFATECGVRLPRQEHVHKKLAMLLHNSRNELVSDAGKSLDDMKRDRNRADYDLSDKRWESRQFALTAASHAAVIVKELAALRSGAEWTSTVSAMRDSAKILGLPIVD